MRSVCCSGFRRDVGRTVDSKKLQHGCRVIYVGFSFFRFFGLGLEDGQIPTFGLLLYRVSRLFLKSPSRFEDNDFTQHASKLAVAAGAHSQKKGRALPPGCLMVLVFCTRGPKGYFNMRILEARIWRTPTWWTSEAKFKILVYVRFVVAICTAC